MGGFDQDSWSRGAVTSFSWGILVVRSDLQVCDEAMKGVHPKLNFNPIFLSPAQEVSVSGGFGSDAPDSSSLTKVEGLVCSKHTVVFPPVRTSRITCLPFYHQWVPIRTESSQY
jgi:hypothetical protein